MQIVFWKDTEARLRDSEQISRGVNVPNFPKVLLVCTSWFPLRKILKINFDKGTLILQDVPDGVQTQLSDLHWDARTLAFQTPVRRCVLTTSPTRTQHRNS